MRTMMDMNDLARSLYEQIDAKEDYVTDTRRLGFYVSPPEADDAPAEGVGRVALTIDDAQHDSGDVFTVNDHAQQQIGQRLGIPSKFWDRMRDHHHDILQDTVGKLLVREPEVRMVRTLGDTARAFLSNRYRRLDHYDLLERSVLPALQGQNHRIVSCGLTDTRMYVKVVFEDVTFDLSDNGNTVHGGIAIGNSEVGAGTLFVEPFTYTSFCTNGMIFGRKDYSDFGLRKMHVGRQIEDTEAARAMFSDDTLRKDDEAFYAMAHDMIAGAASGIAFAAIWDAIRKSQGIDVSADPVVAVERLAKATSLTEDESKSVMKHLIEGGDLSAWGYVSAVTRTAEDIESYDRATDLERLGGDMVDWSAKAWRDLAAA